MTRADTVRTAIPSVATGLLTLALLVITRMKAPYEMLIADRFLPGAGWLEIVVLSGYAAWLVRRFETSRDTARLRVTIWLAFSIVFFLQFILGVAGIDRFLMTGTLHVPVPAVVIAGPIYRGSRFFMPILFLSTIVLVGPAWCSHLCYIGAWDGLLARRKRRAKEIGQYWLVVRIGVFVATPLAAIVLRIAGAGGLTAAYVAIAFGFVSVGVMIVFTGRSGTMVHCTSVCPLGLAGNLLGKISPFRLRIGQSCTACMRCSTVCRYHALRRSHIDRRRPGYTCTLCGDCIPACRDDALTFSFFGLSATRARRLFLVLVVSLHAVFLAVARI